MKTQYLIVGSGLTGATIARELKDKGFDVIVVERRDHLGGNVYDTTHKSGIAYHVYGPHQFRTNSQRIYDFVSRFTNIRYYHHAAQTFVDGELQAWPPLKSYIDSVVGEDWKPGFEGEPTNFEEASLAMMPKVIYEKFVKGYNIKQWGVDPKTLDAKLARRFTVKEDDDPRLFNYKWQGMPDEGYEQMMKNMLEGIPVILNWDFLQRKDEIEYTKGLVFTGPIDAFFGYKFGKLQYRAQKREHTYLPNEYYVQEGVAISNPQLENGPHVRTIEWKHFMDEQDAARIEGTLLTTETPFTPEREDEYEYPFPSRENEALYAKYREEADALDKTWICGRLGRYQYLDMDQAIGHAMAVTKNILKGGDYVYQS